jgi:hypothetical protein
MTGSPDIEEVAGGGGVQSDNPEKQTMKAVLHFGPGVVPPEGVDVVSNVDAQHEAMNEVFRAQGVDEAVLAQRSARMPISQQEYDLAMHRKNILMADKAWVSRYFAGGAAEKKEFGTLHVLLGSTIKKDEANA